MTARRGGGRVLAGAMWGYGAQILTIVFQLAYAAVVSRLAGAQEFGAYSVALSITALISLIANGGMSQAVARLQDIDKNTIGAMTSFALILGLAVATITFFTAEFWAVAWRVPAAADTIRWLSISAVLSPMFSLLTGLARRTGRFSGLAVSTVVCNVAGMGIGIAAVATWGNSSSLVVSAVSAQFFLVAWLVLRYREYLKPRPLTAALPHVAFSAKLVVAGILQYAVGNVGKWTATRVFGASVMGQWNRAEVLTTIPMQQAQTAMVQAAYPEFRHDIDSPARAQAVWADMLVLVAWFSATTAMVLVAFAPLLIPWILGAAWVQAAAFAVPLSIGVAIQPVSVLLASALESLGSFRRIWLTDVVLLLLQILLIVWMISADDVSVIIWSIALTNAARLIIHSAVAAKIGYLNVRTLAIGFLQVGIGCLAVLALCEVLKLSILSVARQEVWVPGSWIGVGILPVVVAVLFFAWRKLPPVKLAAKYGLIAAKGNK